MTKQSMQNSRAVILCGGRGSRMGSITNKTPKPLLIVQDKPILWYTVLMLYKIGLRSFIFPLGYKGEMIKKFISQEFGDLDCQFQFVDTGEDSPISKRIMNISGLIPKHADFLLLNGDTLFDFDIPAMYQLHRQKDSLLTLASVKVVSPFGLLIEEEGNLVDFARDQRVSYLALNENHVTRGYLNSGFAWLNKDALQFVDLSKSKSFEHALYSKIIRMGRAAHYKIKGNWLAIDTLKDLKIVNMELQNKELGKFVMKMKKTLEGLRK
jgi:glucose-1-phosphate cytidylyltransferase